MRHYVHLMLPVTLRYIYPVFCPHFTKDEVVSEVKRLTQSHTGSKEQNSVQTQAYLIPKPLCFPYHMVPTCLKDLAQVLSVVSFSILLVEFSAYCDFVCIELD